MIMIMKQKKIKIEPRIKLNHNIDTEMLSQVTIGNRHFKHNIQNRQRDVVSSSGIDTLYTFGFRRILDV